MAPVHIDVWTDLRVSGAPDAPFSVVHVQVERPPNKKLPPRPLWLAWIGGPGANEPEHTVALVFAAPHG